MKSTKVNHLTKLHAGEAACSNWSLISCERLTKEEALGLLPVRERPVDPQESFPNEEHLPTLTNAEILDQRRVAVAKIRTELEHRLNELFKH
jgi:hypothetical protein